ncbi:MAG: hypothetical protein HY936_01205 [Nitrosomonadales bacterium]|nr:hypothetical protein [Nitrosomonadales bacterium]
MGCKVEIGDWTAFSMPYPGSAPSFFASSLAVVAWVGIVGMAMKVTEAMIRAPVAFMPTSAPGITPVSRAQRMNGSEMK